MATPAENERTVDTGILSTTSCVEFSLVFSFIWESMAGTFLCLDTRVNLLAEKCGPVGMCVVPRSLPLLLPLISFP